MAHIRVTRDFDYRWPSGSITAFKASPDKITTRRECVDDAVKNGWGVDLDKVDKPTDGK